MRIPLEDIATFSKCPRYFRFTKQSIPSPKSKRLSIIEKVIRKAYSRRTQYNRHSEWKSIIGWVDKEVFKDVDMDNEDAFVAARKLSENTLLFLEKWYRSYYIGNFYPVYVDISLSFDYGSNIVTGTLPIVELRDKPTIIYFDEVDSNVLRIHKDIKVLGWACMLLEELDTDEINVNHIYIGNKSGLDTQPATIKRDRVKRVKETIREIATSISAGVSYPSYTDMCGGCSFRRSCRL